MGPGGRFRWEAHNWSKPSLCSPHLRKLLSRRRGPYPNSIEGEAGMDVQVKCSQSSKNRHVPHIGERSSGDA